MPCSARHQDVGPCARGDLLLADGEGEVTVEHEERLLELLVEVRHRPWAFAAAEFRERECSAGGISGRQYPHVYVAQTDAPPVARSHSVRAA
ncbi:MAG TPA: hypothetical protein VHJ18_30050 [Streptosporangiaceae bacterium]|nr:hypothetical protein [Streptosporangiaceae bacterium]